MVALSGGIYGGVKPPRYLSGKVYIPQHVLASSGTLAVTATRRYYVPFFCSFTQTFAGMKTYNSGVGDNGKKIRMGVYNEATTGGPGTLVAEVSETTLTGASAIRTATGSMTLIGGQMYFLCFTSDTAPTMHVMGHFTSAAGSVAPAPFSTQHGIFTWDVGSTDSRTQPLGDYVDTAYGALPSTAVAPTASVSVQAVSPLPLFGLYV